MTAIVGEVSKVSAFVRRDFLVAWSYRMAFLTDWAALLLQLITFYFVGRLVSPQSLPVYGGKHATYVEFVSIGIAVTSFLQVGVGRVVTAMRAEQLMGTLEVLMISPTSATVLQLGSAAYEALYVPIRTGVFLGLVALVFDARFVWSGVAPALLVLVLFVVVVWGLGLISAAGTLTFRRGGTFAGVGVTLFTLTSGAFFPLSLLPSWLGPLRVNPVAVVLEAERSCLLGGTGWSELPRALLELTPMAVVFLIAGLWCFRLALRRERRRGTLGLY